MLIQSRKLVLEFTKMSGTGNDFIVIDNRFYHFSGAELSQMAKKLCQRRLGVGADGLLALGNPISQGAIYRMSYYNADGSLGTMCGNGARCLAKYAQDAGLKGEPPGLLPEEVHGVATGRSSPMVDPHKEASKMAESTAKQDQRARQRMDNEGGLIPEIPLKSHDQSFVFDSDAGLYSAVVYADSSRVRLYVPKPQKFKSDIKLEASSAPNPWIYHSIWTGTEHVVLYVDDVQSIDVSNVGSALRFDAGLKPVGANINFVEVLTDGSLRVRTFEKGVEAETLACGTGSIACAIVSSLVGAIPAAAPVTIHMSGGDLEVGWGGHASDPDAVYLEGSVDTIYRASTEI